MEAVPETQAKARAPAWPARRFLLVCAFLAASAVFGALVVSGPNLELPELAQQTAEVTARPSSLQQEQVLAAKRRLTSLAEKTRVTLDNVRASTGAPFLGSHADAGHSQQQHEAQQPAAVSAELLQPRDSTQFKPWELWHIVWRVPDSFERGYRSARVFDNRTFTGCCDRILALSISSVLVHHPEAQIWLWTNDVNATTESIRANLVNSERVFCRVFDLNVDMRSFPNIINAYSHDDDAKRHHHLRSINWADLVRLSALNNYGGSYIDADIVLLNNVPAKMRQRGVPDNKMHDLFNLVPHVPKNPKLGVPCDLFLIEKSRRENTTCMMANTALLNFKPQTSVIGQILKEMDRTILAVTKKSFDRLWFNAFFFSAFVRKTWLEGARDFAYVTDFYIDVGARASRVSLSKPSDMGTSRQGAHLELETGEAVNMSQVHFMLCRNSRILGITSKPAEPCDEVLRAGKYNPKK